MCATVCPSGALTYGSRGDIEQQRQTRARNTFVFGPQIVRTKVQIMLPAEESELELDVAAFME